MTIVCSVLGDSLRIFWSKKYTYWMSWRHIIKESPERSPGLPVESAMPSVELRGRLLADGSHVRGLMMSQLAIEHIYKVAGMIYLQVYYISNT